MKVRNFVLAAFLVCAAESTSISWDGICPLIVNGTCPDNQHVTFTLYTSSKPNGEILDVAANKITSTSFNAGDPTKIIIHGYMDNPAGNVAVIQQAYLSKGKYNAITVDWSFLAQGPCYTNAMINLRHVGQCTGQLVQLLRKSSAVDIHVIGHSLGAQMTNFVALNVDPILPRISGLDPAGPNYPTGLPLNEVLDKSDATFVDVYHTNDNEFGRGDPSGHVDFYFNGGMFQPGCVVNGPTDIEERAVQVVVCSHSRAVKYFAESITSKKGFYGTTSMSLSDYDVTGLLFPPSPLTILAGENVNKSTSGIVSVTTAASPPFALGQ